MGRPPNRCDTSAAQSRPQIGVENRAGAGHGWHLQHAIQSVGMRPQADWRLHSMESSMRTLARVGRGLPSGPAVWTSPVAAKATSPNTGWLATASLPGIGHLKAGQKRILKCPSSDRKLLILGYSWLENRYPGIGFPPVLCIGGPMLCPTGGLRMAYLQSRPQPGCPLGRGALWARLPHGFRRPTLCRSRCASRRNCGSRTPARPRRRRRPGWW